MTLKIGDEGSTFVRGAEAINNNPGEGEGECRMRCLGDEGWVRGLRDGRHGLEEGYGVNASMGSRLISRCELGQHCR